MSEGGLQPLTHSEPDLSGWTWQRHEAERPVMGAVAQTGMGRQPQHAVLGGALGQHHALGQAGGARRVKDERLVLSPRRGRRFQGRAIAALKQR